MSAHIAITCNTCGKIRLGAPFAMYDEFRADIEKDGWSSDSTIDTCPFCAAKRKARERVETTK